MYHYQDNANPGLGTVEFYSEIAKSFNFTAEHTEDSGLEV